MALVIALKIIVKTDKQRIKSGLCPFDSFTTARAKEIKPFWHTLRKEMSIYFRLLLIRFMDGAFI